MCVDCEVFEVPNKGHYLVQNIKPVQNFFLFEPLVKILLLLKIPCNVLIVF